MKAKARQAVLFLKKEPKNFYLLGPICEGAARLSLILRRAAIQPTITTAPHRDRWIIEQDKILAARWQLAIWANEDRRMREVRFLAIILILAICTACAGPSGWPTSPSGNAQQQSTNAQRILPGQVNWSTNLVAFEAQIRHDLPIGTPKNDVETYLTRWSIPHYFVASRFDGDPDGNSFQCMLNDIGTRIIFQVYLEIWIRLDGDGKVRAIDFRPAADAP
jgi:hypothetical protein